MAADTTHIKEAAAHLARMGRGGDTLLAHLTSEEMEFLKAHGGKGDINPHTGLFEFEADASGSAHGDGGGDGQGGGGDGQGTGGPDGGQGQSGPSPDGGGMGYNAGGKDPAGGGAMNWGGGGAFGGDFGGNMPSTSNWSGAMGMAGQGNWTGAGQQGSIPGLPGTTGGWSFGGAPTMGAQQASANWGGGQAAAPSSGPSYTDTLGNQISDVSPQNVAAFNAQDPNYQSDVSSAVAPENQATFAAQDPQQVAAHQVAVQASAPAPTHSAAPVSAAAASISDDAQNQNKTAAAPTEEGTVPSGPAPDAVSAAPTSELGGVGPAPTQAPDEVSKAAPTNELSGAAQPAPSYETGNVQPQSNAQLNSNLGVTETAAPTEGPAFGPGPTETPGVTSSPLGATMSPAVDAYSGQPVSEQSPTRGTSFVSGNTPAEDAANVAAADQSIAGYSPGYRQSDNVQVANADGTTSPANFGTPSSNNLVGAAQPTTDEAAAAAVDAGLFSGAPISQQQQELSNPALSPDAFAGISKVGSQATTQAPGFSVADALGIGEAQAAEPPTNNLTSVASPLGPNFSPAPAPAMTAADQQQAIATALAAAGIDPSAFQPDTQYGRPAAPAITGPAPDQVNDVARNNALTAAAAPAPAPTIAQDQVSVEQPMDYHDPYNLQNRPAVTLTNQQPFNAPMPASRPAAIGLTNADATPGAMAAITGATDTTNPRTGVTTVPNQAVMNAEQVGVPFPGAPDVNFPPGVVTKNLLGVDTFSNQLQMSPEQYANYMANVMSQMPEYAGVPIGSLLGIVSQLARESQLNPGQVQTSFRGDPYSAGANVGLGLDQSTTADRQAFNVEQDPQHAPTQLQTATQQLQNIAAQMHTPSLLPGASMIGDINVGALPGPVPAATAFVKGYEAPANLGGAIGSSVNSLGNALSAASLGNMFGGNQYGSVRGRR